MTRNSNNKRLFAIAGPGGIASRKAAPFASILAFQLKLSLLRPRCWHFRFELPLQLSHIMPCAQKDTLGGYPDTIKAMRSALNFRSDLVYIIDG